MFPLATSIARTALPILPGAILSHSLMVKVSNSGRKGCSTMKNHHHIPIKTHHYIPKKWAVPPKVYPKRIVIPRDSQKKHPKWKLHVASSTKALRLRPRSALLGGASSAAERLVSFLGGLAISCDFVGFQLVVWWL